MEHFMHLKVNRSRHLYCYPLQIMLGLERPIISDTDNQMFLSLVGVVGGFLRRDVTPLRNQWCCVSSQKYIDSVTLIHPLMLLTHCGPVMQYCGGSILCKNPIFFTMKEFLIDIIIFENPLQKLHIFTFWLFLGEGSTLAKKSPPPKKFFLEVVGRKRP